MSNEYPFAKRRLMTDKELLFFNVLNKVATEKGYRVFSKVRMEDIIHVKTTGYREIQNQRAKIKSKHIDYVICDFRANVLMCFELDDSTHNEDSSLKYDDFKDRALEAAGIPLHRIPTTANYKVALAEIFK